jgi:hypothetical protein
MKVKHIWKLLSVSILIGILSSNIVIAQYQKDAFYNYDKWKTSFDTTEYFHLRNYDNLYIDSTTMNSVVFEIDSENNIKVPSGWEYILVIKNGECWASDSSRKNRSISQPNIRNLIRH